jgi:hypothetical protein
MHGLSAAEVLDVWEQGYPLGPVGRSMVLHARARPDLATDSLAATIVGRQGSDLLELRRATFGPELSGVVSCPACGQVMEVGTTVEALLSDQVEPPETLTVTAGDLRVEVRLPTAGDLLELERRPDLDEEAAVLFLTHRCLPTGQVTEEMGPEVRTAVAEAVGGADEGADVQLAVTCAGCGHTWTSPLDIADWLWREVDAWARRLAEEVHALAWAYGWSERDVLSLSPWRRGMYLELVGQ